MIGKVKKGSIVRIRQADRQKTGARKKVIVSVLFYDGCVRLEKPLEGCTYWNVGGLEIKTAGGWLNAR